MKSEIDLVFVACITSVVLIVLATALGLFTGNDNWYNAAWGPWTIFVCSLIVGAVRTIRGKG